MTPEFKTPSQMDGDLVDWPPVERDGYVFGRVGTVISALVSAAYKAMASPMGVWPSQPIRPSGRGVPENAACLG